MKISRRGVIVGGSAALAACGPAMQAAPEPALVAELPPVPTAPVAVAAIHDTPPPLDPRNRVRRDLMERAMAALDIHHHRVPLRDRMYLVDFRKHSSEERFYEVDLIEGDVRAYRTCHGRGSDPQHTGFAQRFSNEPESHMSSVGSYVTAGPNWGNQQGPNVLLDGLEYSNNLARDRAIIIHGADYADPAFLEREGKLGRSYGCFSVAHNDLWLIRDRMGEGRLLFAMS